MVLLVRSAAETRDVEAVTAIMLIATGVSVLTGDMEATLASATLTLQGIGFLVGPSRSWASGLNRVAVWSFDNMYTEDQCWDRLRWRKNDIPTLVRLLQLPDTVRLSHPSETRRGAHHIFSGIECLVVFLARMASPAPWTHNLDFLGGRSRPSYIIAFYFVLEHITQHFGHCISDINRWTAWAAVFAQAIVSAGAPAPRCIGFIDGTIRATCRPSRNQQFAYTGYGRRHGLKFQSVVSPNGLITDLFGPILARRGDGYLLRQSQILQRMAAFCAAAGGNYYLYGDPAYPLNQYLLRGFKGPMTAQQQAFSTAMSSVRESVEWGYAIIVSLFPFLDFKKRMKMLQMPVGLLYPAGAILSSL